MKQKTLKKFIGYLNECSELNVSKAEYERIKSLCKNYLSTTFFNVKTQHASGLISEVDMNSVQSAWDLCGKKKPETPELPFTKSEEMTLEQVELEADDTRNSINLVRDDEGKIRFYEFKVLRSGREPLFGKLTREEMSDIYRLYSYYGASITQREISRKFPEYSLIDFKRILRVFSITKAVSPFAPHTIEEHSKTELMTMQMREKENDFLRGVEEQSIKNDRILLKKYALENIELKRTLEQGIKIDLSGLDLGKLPYYRPVQLSSNVSKDVVVYLSDMHIGAYVSPLSIYSNPWDKVEVFRRMDLILDQLDNLSTSFQGFDNIYICNLGDSLDGYDQQTTRGGHALPQNMNNKEQIHTFIECMNYFFTKLSSIPSNNRHYICVGESNHDGDFGYAANIALEAILSHSGINCTIFDKFIGEFKIKDTTFILCHGKDNKDMFKNLPLTLDIKTENFINEYLDNKRISGIDDNVVFVKGDLHQSATTEGRRFTYKSVGSLFGSSEWIHKNFGNTAWGCDYSVLDADGSRIDGIVKDKK